MIKASIQQLWGSRFACLCVSAVLPSGSQPTKFTIKSYQIKQGIWLGSPARKFRWTFPTDGDLAGHMFSAPACKQLNFAIDLKRNDIWSTAIGDPKQCNSCLNCLPLSNRWKCNIFLEDSQATPLQRVATTCCSASCATVATAKRTPKAFL